MLSIGIGSKTSTGGAVIEGNSGILFDGLVASSVGHKATCPACKKGVGEIVAVGARTTTLPAGPAARAGDYVACGCPSGANILVAQGTVRIGSNQAGSTYSGAGSKGLSATTQFDNSKARCASGDTLNEVGPNSATIKTFKSELSAVSNNGFDPGAENYRYYDFESEICQIDSFCNLESVAVANRMHPAPGMLSNISEVVDGQVSNAQIGYATEHDDFGPVVHSVSADGLIVRNTTLSDHNLFPGYVERQVFQRDNKVYIRTIGEGTGPMGSANEMFSIPMWAGLVNAHIRYRISLAYRK
ncbi:PAAR domain-containing protein [Halopseudomonas laoshanensis]|uniref:PAAR domain-containing protein n=1 Tax=Halopseudomonas laoshanensis TaxID=2268758 RepID=UPI003734C7D0